MTKFNLQVFTCFFLIVPIGTVLHEFGHFIVAKLFYLTVYICYSSTYKFNYIGKIEENVAEVIVALAGPISTILISIIFTFIIFKSYRKSHELKFLIKLSFALFMSREIYISLFVIFKLNHTNTDEYRIFRFFEINPTIGAGVLLILSVMFCAVVTYKSIPRERLLYFLIYGFIGSVVGFLTWNDLGLGKAILSMSQC